MPLLLPAGNPSEWTGPTGTNTWLIRGREPALIDSGAGLPGFVDVVAAALGGAALTRVCLTHSHVDHAGGVASLRARWPQLEVVPVDRYPAVVAAGDGELEIVATPGHAPEHLCYFDRASGDLYCGDLARLGGTVVIPASGGGDLRQYLDSLARIRALAPRRLLPGHGPIVTDPLALIDEYVAHRHARDAQIRAAQAAGARTIEEIVDAVYPGLAPSLRLAAADSVAAHLAAARNPEPDEPRTREP